MEQAGAGDCISEDNKWFQDKAGERKIKEDGPVSRLKSAGPRGRSSFGDNGRTCELPVSMRLVISTQPPPVEQGTHCALQLLTVITSD